ncbi:hypothetical protein D3C86_1693130 [compost metagenome]
MRPDGEDQKRGDSQARDHGWAQPQQGINQAQNQGRGQGRGWELGQNIGPAVADAGQRRQGDGGGRGQQAQRRQVDRGLQG